MHACARVRGTVRAARYPSKAVRLCNRMRPSRTPANAVIAAPEWLLDWQTRIIIIRSHGVLHPAPGELT
jgi:hypothetical protein